MASLDNVFDLTEKFENDGISYFVIAVQKRADADDEYSSDVFYNIKDDEVNAVVKDTIQGFFATEESKPSRKGRKPKRRKDSEDDEMIC